MITTKKSLLAVTLVSALGLGMAPASYAQNDSEEKTEYELDNWDVSNPPYALNEVTIKTTILLTIEMTDCKIERKYSPTHNFWFTNFRINAESLALSNLW